MVTEITKDNVSLLDDRLIIAKFYGTTCTPCKIVASAFEGISEEVNAATFVAVNVDEHPELATKYALMSVPTVLVLDGGNVVDQATGVPKINGLFQKVRSGLK